MANKHRRVWLVEWSESDYDYYNVGIDSVWTSRKRAAVRARELAVAEAKRKSGREIVIKAYNQNYPEGEADYLEVTHDGTIYRWDEHGDYEPVNI